MKVLRDSRRLNKRLKKLELRADILQVRGGCYFTFLLIWIFHYVYNL